MKRLLICIAAIAALAAAAAADDQRLPMLGQAADQPQSEAAPTPAPAAPNMDAGSAPQEVKRQPHRDFAAMEIRECTSCHTGSGVAPNHDMDWVRRHRTAAIAPTKNCADCHRQGFCLDCHAGGGIDVDLNVEIARASTAPHTHRTDWRELHPLKALNNPQTCSRCHDSRYCTQCHAKFRGEDLRVLSHRRGWSDLQTSSGGPAHSTFNRNQCQTCHPRGVLPKHVWSADHAREARRNLQSCQACHSDGQTCLTCHSARAGLMVNPHPRGWDKVAAKYRSKSDGRSCIRCHDSY